MAQRYAVRSPHNAETGHSQFAKKCNWEIAFIDTVLSDGLMSRIAIIQRFNPWAAGNSYSSFPDLQYTE
jgi:hypothetical protein